jgi:putative radical SAM enzyme (TIGR03279 family)
LVAPKAAGKGARARASGGVRIGHVTQKSPAAKAGLKTGDVITEVNGRKVTDFLDVFVAAFEDHLALKVRSKGKVKSLEVKRVKGQSLGAELESGKPWICNNKCVFCFVDQMPKGLRKELYVKDEDYRFSFLHGNYLTMTNLKPGDEKRIVDLNLWPLYVSVHSTDEDVRARLLGKKPGEGILQILDRLGSQGIGFHTQIVVVPGMNDGVKLGRTLADLCARHDYILSVSVVPVGLTCHREGLPPLKMVNSALAGEIVNVVQKFQDEMRRTTWRGVVYAADELFLLAGLPIPPGSYYDDYPQTDNGVGLMRMLLDSAENIRLPSVLKGKKVVFITGALAAPHLEKITSTLTKRGLKVDVVAAANRLFGPMVTVSGLLSGKDMIDAVGDPGSYDAAILPPGVLNADGVTLDDMTLKDMSDRLGLPVMVGGYDIKETLKRLKDEFAG